MVRLEKIAQVRYAGGLAMQQDAIRAQVEQTGMRNDLIMLENERNMLQARNNMLLARPASAPLARPPRHSTAPNSDGANWASAAKDTRPMAASPLVRSIAR